MNGDNVLVFLGSGSLISMFEENIHSLVTRLPRVIRMAGSAVHSIVALLIQW